MFKLLKETTSITEQIFGSQSKHLAVFSYQYSLTLSNFVALREKIKITLNKNTTAFAESIMKVVIQRVSRASVTIEGKKVASIEHGLLILLGIVQEDTQEDIIWLTKKVANLRVFNDENGVMNTSLLDSNGDAIVVSQFTLQASTKKGNRPSYIKAARPEIAIPLYNAFNTILESVLNKPVQTGVFGADMKVQLLNDGPVTIIIDSKNKE